MRWVIGIRPVLLKSPLMSYLPHHEMSSLCDPACSHRRFAAMDTRARASREIR